MRVDIYLCRFLSKKRLTDLIKRCIIRVMYNSNYIWRCKYACENKSHKRNDR